MDDHKESGKESKGISFVRQTDKTFMSCIRAENDLAINSYDGV